MNHEHGSSRESDGTDSKDKDWCNCDHGSWHRHRMMKRHGPMGGAYFLAFLGAFVYYIQHATTFGMGLLGFLKACVWPAMVVYHLMAHLGM